MAKWLVHIERTDKNQLVLWVQANQRTAWSVISGLSAVVAAFKFFA
jgi:hypothetical protein